MRYLRFFLPFAKNKFPLTKITATILFPQKFTPERIFSNFENLLHKNTVLGNRVCSITICLYCSEAKRFTTKYWFT